MAAFTIRDSGDRAVDRSVASVAVLAGVALGGALFLQHVVGIQPCPLCLEQRYAYYAVLAVCACLAAARTARLRVPAAALLALVALLMLGNAGLGVYHAGVEWGWWPGPTACAGAVSDFGAAGSLLGRIDAVKVVRCDEVQFRFLGLSLAGYSVLVSSAMALAAGYGALAARRSGRTAVS